MEDKIKREIEDDNLSKAKELIEIYESSIFLEKSDYIRAKMQEKLNILKNFYSNKTSVLEINIEKNKFNIENLQKQNKTQNVKNYKNLTNEKINEKEKFSFITISNCKNCEFNLQIDQCLVINNCNDIIVYIHGSQVRIKNSRNVSLTGLIESGISLEDSTNIKIKGDLKENNNFKNVKDFSNPFSNRNYSFL